MSRPFEIPRTVTIRATPEQVWDAVRTPEGIASWLFPVPPGEDGSAWGGHEAIISDAPLHSLMRMTGPDGETLNQLEHEITDNGDGTVTLRYVHSGVFGDADWDTQYDGASNHTDFYLHSLGQYLEHFPGQHATYVGVDGPEASSQAGSFVRVLQAMDVSPDAKAGDPARFDVDGYGTVDGTIDYLSANLLGIRTDDALYRVYGREIYGGAPTALGHHLFAGDVDGEAATAAWSRWFEGVFAAQVSPA